MHSVALAKVGTGGWLVCVQNSSFQAKSMSHLIPINAWQTDVVAEGLELCPCSLTCCVSSLLSEGGSEKQQDESQGPE